MALLAPISERDGWFAGEDKLLDFSIVKADEITPENITGWTMKWELYRHFGAAEVSLQKNASVQSGSGGIARVTVLAADTAALAPGRYEHVLWRVDSGGKTVLSYGPAQLLGAPIPT